MSCVTVLHGTRLWPYSHLWRPSRYHNPHPQSAAALTEDRASLAAKYSIARIHTGSCPRQSHRSFKGDRRQGYTQKSAQHTDVNERAVRKYVTRDNEQESDQTTDRCSPSLRITQSASYNHFSVPFSQFTTDPVQRSSPDGSLVHALDYPH